MAKIDSVFDFTDKGLVELKSWLEPWFQTRGGTGGDGGLLFNQGSYGPYNVGDWLSVETTSQGGNLNVGIGLQSDDGSMYFLTTGDNNGGIFENTTGDGNSGIYLATSGDTNGGIVQQTTGTGNSGIWLDAQDDATILGTGDGGVKFTSAGDNVTSSEVYPTTFGMVLESTATGGNMQLSTYGSASGIRLHAPQGMIGISCAADSVTGQGFTVLSEGNALVHITGTGEELYLAVEDGRIRFSVNPGFSFDFRTQDTASPIARLDYNGTLHLKSGATIVYDL